MLKRRYFSFGLLLLLTSAVAPLKAAAAFAGDFTLGLTPNSAVVTVPGDAIATVSITFSGGFSDTVVFSCSGVPVNSFCSFSPPSVPGTLAPAISTLGISTQLVTMRNDPHPRNGSTIFFAATGLAGFLAAFALHGPRSRRRLLRHVTTLCALAAFSAIFTACGDDTPLHKEIPVAAGVYNITVTGTGGGVSHSAAFMFTVKPKVPFQ